MPYDATQVSDVLELKDLACRYAKAVDGRDATGLCALFVEDGLLDGSGYYAKGHEAFAKIPPMLSKRYEATFHAVLNHTLTLHGDEAEGEVYALSHHLRREKDDSLVDYVMVMRYRDRYVRQDGAWRFAHRHILLDWTETRPASPPAHQG
jgi:hypothetical protein